MGFGINMTVISGAVIGSAWAVDSDLGAAATGAVGTLYACAMSSYGVFSVFGAAANALSSDGEDNKKKQQSTSKQLANSMKSIAQKSDSEMQKFQQLARVSGRLKAHDD